MALVEKSLLYIPVSVVSFVWIGTMSSSQAFEEDVFVEEDLEEDEYLYQVAINFGDPNGSQNGSPGQRDKTLEYVDDTDEEDTTQSKKSKTRLPHNPNSGGFEGRKDRSSPAAAFQPDPSSLAQETSPVVPMKTISEDIEVTSCSEYPTNEDQQVDTMEPGSVLDFAKVFQFILHSHIYQFICNPHIHFPTST